MSQILRDYQTAAVHAVFDALEMGYTRVLYTLPTGTGKTSVFSEIVRLLTEYHSYKVLVLAHRKELIDQAYNRIKDHCGFDEYQIGEEIAEEFASSAARVIVGSVQTVKGVRRLPNFTPDVIICDEAHHAAAASYLKIQKRFSTPEKPILYIGCTATAKRTDSASLYAIKPDGSPVQLYDKKAKKPFSADPTTSVFEYLCYEYSLMDAIEGGYLVPIKGQSVETETDISDVKTGIDGDFQEGALAKAVDNNYRTLLAINAWKEVASHRPTLVFCASVEHAHHSADLWRQAGYTAVVVDGETPKHERFEIFRDFKLGKIQVLCNMGIATEGTDLPNCACIVHLRPTKSWTLYSQMSGRGTRTLPGVIDGIDDPERRLAAIAASDKPDCLIIDLVDLYAKNDLCAVPSILDLPSNLDLQGASLTETKKLLDEFEEVKDRVIGECPTTFQELKVRLETVNLLRGSGARTQDAWKATESGYRCVRVPVGYQAEILQQGDAWELVVKNAGSEILRKKARPQASVKALVDHASRWIGHAIEQHKASLPPVSRGTLLRLTQKQVNCLKVNGHTCTEIDAMPYPKAKALIAQYMDRWKARQSAPRDTDDLDD